MAVKIMEMVAISTPMVASFVEEGGHPGGKTEEEAEEEQDQAPRPDGGHQRVRYHHQAGPHSAQQDGGPENPAALFPRLDDHALVEPVGVDQVVDFSLADIPAAPAQGKEVDQGEADCRQPQGGEGEAEREGVGQLEQGQGHRPEGLVEQSAQGGPQRQSAASHGQVFQKKQPGHLSVLQADEQVGAQLPAPAQEHEFGGIGHQPAEDAHHNHSRQGDHYGQHLHGFGQGLDLLGEGQGVEGVEQGGGHDHRDEIDQIVLCLALGVAQGELR